MDLLSVNGPASFFLLLPPLPEGGMDEGIGLKSGGWGSEVGVVGRRCEGSCPALR